MVQYGSAHHGRADRLEQMHGAIAEMGKLPTPGGIS